MQPLQAIQASSSTEYSPSATHNASINEANHTAKSARLATAVLTTNQQIETSEHELKVLAPSPFLPIPRELSLLIIQHLDFSAKKKIALVSQTGHELVLERVVQEAAIFSFEAIQWIHQFLLHIGSIEMDGEKIKKVCDVIETIHWESPETALFDFRAIQHSLERVCDTLFQAVKPLDSATKHLLGSLFDRCYLSNTKRECVGREEFDYRFAKRLIRQPKKAKSYESTRIDKEVRSTKIGFFIAPFLDALAAVHLDKDLHTLLWLINRKEEFMTEEAEPEQLLQAIASRTGRNEILSNVVFGLHERSQFLK